MFVFFSSLLQSVVCTAGLKWYPHPSLIHCVKGCEVSICIRSDGPCLLSYMLWSQSLQPCGLEMFFQWGKQAFALAVLSIKQRSPAPVVTSSGEAGVFSKTDGWVTLA